eukprot:6197741-Pleurochrysis_carterae.AAC.2
MERSSSSYASMPDYKYNRLFCCILGPFEIGAGRICPSVSSLMVYVVYGRLTKCCRKCRLTLVDLMRYQLRSLEQH